MPLAKLYKSDGSSTEEFFADQDALDKFLSGKGAGEGYIRGQFL